MSVQEMEERQSSQTRVVAYDKTTGKGRHKNLLAAPSHEIPSGEFVKIVTETLHSNGQTLGWNEATAEHWAIVLLRDLRFGIPVKELGGEGYPFVDADYTIPMCDECQDD